VRAAKIVLDHIERFLPSAAHSIVLHWFSGSISEMKRASELGCYFSVNSQMLAGERGQSLVRQISPDRLLTETDGPFTECRGRPAGPADIPHTLDTLARHLGTSPDQLATLISENLRRLLTVRT
jgi:TatD DNase family protein